MSADTPTPDQARDDIPPGRTTSTKDAAANNAPSYAETKAAEKAASDKARMDALDPIERRRQELNRPGEDGIYSKDPKKAAAAMAELRVVMAKGMTDAERQEVADAPIGQLRDQFGIDRDQVPKYLRGSWNEHAEGTILATASQQGVQPAAMKEAFEYYASQFNGAVGNVANVDVAEMESGVRAIFKKHGVAQEVVDALVTYEKERLGLS